jgi:hypothetical protein
MVTSIFTTGTVAYFKNPAITVSALSLSCPLILQSSDSDNITVLRHYSAASLNVFPALVHDGAIFEFKCPTLIGEIHHHDIHTSNLAAFVYSNVLLNSD